MMNTVFEIFYKVSSRLDFASQAPCKFTQVRSCVQHPLDEPVLLLVDVSVGLVRCNYWTYNQNFARGKKNNCNLRRNITRTQRLSISHRSRQIYYVFHERNAIFNSCNFTPHALRDDRKNLEHFLFIVAIVILFTQRERETEKSQLPCQWFNVKRQLKRGVYHANTCIQYWRQYL